MKKMKLLFMFLLVFNLTSAQKKKIVVKPNQIDTKYIGKWSNENLEIYNLPAYIEITKASITYYSSQFAENLRYIIQGDRILIYYKNMEGSIKWNSNPKEDNMPKCIKPIGFMTKEDDTIVFTIEDDVCGRLPDGKHILKKYVQVE